MTSSPDDDALAALRHGDLDAVRTYRRETSPVGRRRVQARGPIGSLPWRRSKTKQSRSKPIVEVLA